MTDKSIYSFRSLFVQRNKEKLVKAFFFQTIDSRLWSSQRVSSELYQHKSLEKQKLIFSHSALFRMKTRVSVKYFVNDCLWKQFFASNLPQTPPNLIYLTIFVTPRPFAEFWPKTKAIKFKKILKFFLLANCFSDLFSEVKI